MATAYTILLPRRPRRGRHAAPRAARGPPVHVAALLAAVWPDASDALRERLLAVALRAPPACWGAHGQALDDLVREHAPDRRGVGLERRQAPLRPW